MDDSSTKPLIADIQKECLEEVLQAYRMGNSKTVLKRKEGVIEVEVADKQSGAEVQATFRGARA